MSQRSIMSFFGGGGKPKAAPALSKSAVASTPKDKGPMDSATSTQEKDKKKKDLLSDDDSDQGPPRALKRLRRTADAAPSPVDDCKGALFSPEQGEALPKASAASKKRRAKAALQSEESDFEAESESESESEGDDFIDDGSDDEPIQKKKKPKPAAKRVTAPKPVSKPKATPAKAKATPPSAAAAGGPPKAPSMHRPDPHWCLPQNIRDANKRRPDDPLYDATTVYVPPSEKFTPAMAQWWEFKKQHFDKILLFKMGKFYELFEMDADVAHTELGLAFMGSTDKKHVGFPEVSLAPYTAKLTQRGYRCAVIEQTETPDELKVRNENRPKGKPKIPVVRRELCQVVTKGTRFDPGTINEASASFLLSLVERHSEEAVRFGAAFVDTATGHFYVGSFEDTELCKPGLVTLLEEVGPVEILYSKQALCPETLQVVRRCAREALMSPLPPSATAATREEVLRKLQKEDLLGEELPEVLQGADELVLRALGGLVQYLDVAMLAKELISLRNFSAYSPGQPAEGPERLKLDGKSIVNLDILANGQNGNEGTLLKHLDHCTTNFGKRLFQEWVLRPLFHVEAIEARLDAVEELMLHKHELKQLRADLGKLPDLERLLARVHANGRKSCRPQAVMFDLKKKAMEEFLGCLQGLQQGCAAVAKFREAIGGEVNSPMLSGIITPGSKLPELSELFAFFDSQVDRSSKGVSTLIPVPGVFVEYDQATEEITEVEQKLRSHLQEQRKRLQCFGIKFVDCSKDLFLLEVPDTVNKALIPLEYEKRSQKKGFVRYYAPETLELVGLLHEKRAVLEALLNEYAREMFGKFSSHYQKWSGAVRCMAQLDALSSLAWTILHADGPMVRPSFVPPAADGSGVIDIEQGRHPTHPTSEFIPNDVKLGAGGAPHCVLVTGPNMGGKSTTLRLTCAVVIMAQLGCHVPATRCALTPVDQIFTRIGANDNIMAGMSTFFVELSETASILRDATPRSLVILDELGRGTSTLDGTAIAYAVTHEIANNAGSNCLFATHYHILTEEFKGCPLIALQHMACLVHEGESSQNITFLYKLAHGACPNSFGMNVGRLAGLTQEILDRGREVSAQFEVQLASLQSSAGRSERSPSELVERIQVGSVEQIKEIWASLQG